MSKNQLYILAAIAALLTAIIYVWGASKEDSPTSERVKSEPQVSRDAGKKPVGPKVKEDSSGTPTKPIAKTKSVAGVTPEQLRLMEELTAAMSKIQKRSANSKAQEAQNTSGQKPQRFATDRDGIQAAMRDKLPELKECFEPWQKLNPELGGRITASYKISSETSSDDKSEARIKELYIKDGGLGNDLLDGCVLASFKSLHFETPDGGGEIEVNYPLTFSGGDDEPDQDQPKPQ